jgi:nucleoside-diphosphate-sugar epimerase
VDRNDYIIGYDDGILITGANGFIGSKVVERLVAYGFRNLRCFMRSSSISVPLRKTIESSHPARIEIVRGNLLSPEDCERAADGIKTVYHLAASTRDKSFHDAYTNSVDTTRNLLEAALKKAMIRRFVNVSSFSVYSNMQLPAGALLDESCPIEREPELRGEPYSYAKIKQEELVRAYGNQHSLPYIIVRPGAVYGPGSKEITGRVGISRPGLLFHLGGANIIPFTYVDNCAEAIVMAGLKQGIDGEVFNVVDDGVLTSREFLRNYKRSVGNIRSVYLPKAISYSLFCLIGTFLTVLRGGSPTKYNRGRWSAYWKGNTYTNEKLKRLLGWTPKVSMEEGMSRYFAYCKMAGEHDA